MAARTPDLYLLLASSTVLYLNLFCTSGRYRCAGARPCCAAAGRRAAWLVCDERDRRHSRIWVLRRVSRRDRDGAMARGTLCILCREPSSSIDRLGLIWVCGRGRSRWWTRSSGKKLQNLMIDMHCSVRSIQRNVDSCIFGFVRLPRSGMHLAVSSNRPRHFDTLSDLAVT
jgi:hypothetical protein